LGYQWLRNGQILVPFGAGQSSLTLSNVQALQAGAYSVTITNLASPSGVASDVAQLDVLGPLTVVEAPQNVTLDPGKTATFRVAATGTPPWFYQWRLNSELLPGETNSSLTLGNVQISDSGIYSVILWNEETMFTPEARLQIKAPYGPEGADDFADRPLINRLADRSGVLQGDNSFATRELAEPVFPGGGKTAWYEWLAPDDGVVSLSLRGSGFDTLLGVFSGTNLGTLKLIAQDDDLGGFHTSALRFNAQAGRRYQWMIDGFDYVGVGGEYVLAWSFLPATALVPEIVSPPVPTAVLNGSEATFRILARPAGLDYQWFFNGKLITGATRSSFTVMQASTVNVGLYSVKVRGSSGASFDSAPVALQLGTTADAVLPDKFQSLSEPLANGNRPGAGFISIGIGGSDSVQSPATNNASLLTPCNNPISTKYRYRGLLATNDGVILVSSLGSEIYCRLAVYPDPISVGAQELDCDSGSALALQPAQLLFNATNGSKYIVVAEAYQTNGNLNLTSTMGIAPPIPALSLPHSVPAGGSFLLSMPATNWVPVPACQWRLDGTNLAGATNTTLLLTNFTASQVGEYSVVVSNFVRSATPTVAALALAQPPFLMHSWITNNGDLRLVISVTNAAPLILQTKTALDTNLAWIPLVTNYTAGQNFRFTNAAFFADPQRFFRAVLRPAPLL
jgi:hypothetical protein